MRVSAQVDSVQTQWSVGGKAFGQQISTVLDRTQGTDWVQISSGKEIINPGEQEVKLSIVTVGNAANAEISLDDFYFVEYLQPGDFCDA